MTSSFSKEKTRFAEGTAKSMLIGPFSSGGCVRSHG